VVLDIEHCLLVCPGTSLTEVKVVLSIPVAAARCHAFLRRRSVRSRSTATKVANHEGNQTRFVLVGKERVPARTGNDKTSIVVFQRAEEPGSLIGILQKFATCRINFTQLLSRPTIRGGIVDYCIIIYADGHVSDEFMADALRDLRTKQGDVKFLGSCPSAGKHTPSSREHADSVGAMPTIN